MKPTLYLIFDTPVEPRVKGKRSFRDEIIEFANETKIPCHIVREEVSFYSDSSCGYNCNTQELFVRRGHNRFGIRPDQYKYEFSYFMKMTEGVLKEELFPVIIHFDNGEMTTEERKMSTSRNYQIPLIYIKKNHKNVNVVWPPEANKRSDLEFSADIAQPWRVKIAYTQQDAFSNCATNLNDLWSELVNLICNLIIGVCIEQSSSLHGQYGAYHSALSMYLLKAGKWQIYEKNMTRPFVQKSLGYIYEEDITYECMKNVWSNQKSFCRIGYKIPKHSELEVTTDDTDQTCDTSKPKGRKIELTNWTSDGNGLIFLALLQKRYFDGALQLLENGYIGIHHILVGCVILDDEINYCLTTTIEKEQLQRLKSAFTERAIAITSHIYEADNKRINASNKEEIIMDGDTNHAERLLLNHGYLRDAIDAENNMYLKNETVKKIVNKTWYGTEQINWLMMFIFIFLAVVHLFVLPIFMINIKGCLLRWLYKKYQLPFLKVVVNMVGFLVLFAAYAYMLLFDYSNNGISNTDWFIIVWIGSFLVDEIKQVVVAVIRKKMKKYANSWWNRLDWLLIVGYTSGMLLRAGAGSTFKNTSKCLLVVTFMLLCVRILNLCCMTEFLGPKLVIIRKMIKQTIAFMIIMTVILVWYSVSFHALLYPNSELSWNQIEHILSTGYWMLFGELNLDGETLTAPYCTFNVTISKGGLLQRCPTELGVYIVPYLRALYGLIAVILLLNLLIAMYSDTFNVVQQQSESYWRRIQLDFLEEYCNKTVFPIHLQLLVLPGTILAIIWFCCSYMRNKYGREQAESSSFNKQPVVIRVFLYDANYDIKLKPTDDAEKRGIKTASRKIDLSDRDASQTIQKLEKIEHMADMLMKRQTALEKILLELL